ncbi:MAG: hypothetical protein GY765_23655, partial [bacterium]|nr:hypothetical protein [bacterium]
IKEVASQKGSYLFLEDIEKKETREIKSANISTFYDEQGRMTHMNILEGCEVRLTSENSETLIASDKIEINLDAETGNITNVLIPVHGRVENKGNTEFSISADEITAVYRDGQLDRSKGKGNVEFIFPDYTGASDSLDYLVKRDLLDLNGATTRIVSGNNTFQSKRFQVHIGKKILTSSWGVKSVILLGKENVLFSQAPLFINSVLFSISEKENKFVYERRINLLQNDISMTAGKLEINDDNNITATENVSLTFKNGEEEMTINGGLLIFNTKEKSIFVSNKAAIKNGDNVLSADSFELNFDTNDEINYISGANDVRFVKDDLYGSSGKVKWLFKENTLILKDMPQIMKKNGGTTIGDELKINLQTNQITILSSKTERTETIIQ